MSTSFKVSSHTLEIVGAVIPMNFISKEVYALNEIGAIAGLCVAMSVGLSVGLLVRQQ